MPSQSDNAIQFSFDSPNSMPAEADLQAAVANTDNPDFQEAAPTAKPAAVEAKVEDTTQPEAKVEAKQEAPASSNPDDLKTYKITVDGQELEVTESDLKSGHMRHRDYTQKTQQLADQRRQWDNERAQYQNELQAIDAFLKDREAVETYLQKAHGVAPGQAIQPPQIDTTQPLSVQDVAKISAYNAEMARQSLSQEFRAEMEATRQTAVLKAAEVELNIQRKELATELESHVNSELNRYPVLKRFDDISEDLMADAHKRLPRGATLADAKAQLTAAVERKVAVIKAIAEDEKKQSAVAAATLKRTSPEPPGGSPSARTEGRKLTLKDADRKDFLKGAEEDLRAFIAANS